MQQIKFTGFDPVEQRELAVIHKIRRAEINNLFITPLGFLDDASLDLMTKKNILEPTEFDFYFKFTSNGEDEFHNFAKLVKTSFCIGKPDYDKVKYAWNDKSTIKTAILRKCGFIPEQGRSPVEWLEIMSTIIPAKQELEVARKFIKYEDDIDKLPVIV